MKLSILHQTHYTYAEVVQFRAHRVLLRPRETPQLRVISYHLAVEPAADVRWMIDAFDNHISMVQLKAVAKDISFSARVEIDLFPGNPFDFIIDSHAEQYPFSYNPLERKALQPFLEVGSPSDCTDVLPWVWKEFPSLPTSSIDVLTQLNARIRERFQYQRRDEEGIQPPDQTLSIKSGSCRDFARLFIEVCRQLGFAARFVSGYLYDPPTGEMHFNNVAEGAMHAWTEVYLPGAGWKGFDPTNGMLANEYFIPCAVANEPRLTSPIQGSYSHANLKVPSTMEVNLTLHSLDGEAAIA